MSKRGTELTGSPMSWVGKTIAFSIFPVGATVCHIIQSTYDITIEIIDAEPNDS